MRSSRSKSGPRVDIEMQDSVEERKDSGAGADDKLMSQVSAHSYQEAAAEEVREERQRLRDKED